MKNKNKRYFYIILFVLSIAILNLIQAQTFTASVEPAIVSAGEQFQVTFTFSGSDVSGVKNLKAPDFGQFVVISGPNQSTSMQWINGQMSASISYTYILYARQPGKFTIGSATIEYKGKTYSTEPVKIEVTQGKPKQDQKKEESTSGVNIEDNLLIKAYADKYRVRQGEQIIVTFKICTRVSVTGYEFSKAPSFDGFWSEDFELPKQPVLTTEVIDGKQYRTAVIKKTALFPTQTGNLKIAPLELRCAVQVQTKRRSMDPFDQFFSDPFFQQLQTVNLEVKSNPLTIVVDPIPTNAPSGFTGAIGKFSLSANVDKKTVKAGDPITLKLSVSGSGNIKLVTIPQPQLPADIEKYEPKISEEVSREGGVIRGKKTAEYLLIPRNSGTRVIEPIKFVYFDLGKNEYVTLYSPKFELSILPGKEFATYSASSMTKEDVRILGEDIRFLKLSIGTLRRMDETQSTATFWVCLFFPPLLFVFSWFYRKRMEKIYGNMPKLLFERAGRVASKRLKKAKMLLEQGDNESYHAEILKVLNEYLEHKLNVSKADFVMEKAIQQLQRGGVSEETIKSLKECIDRAEFARYAPATDSIQARKELIENASKVIKDIEQVFNRLGKS